MIELRGRMISSRPLAKVAVWLGTIVVLTILMMVVFNSLSGRGGGQTIGQLRALQVAQTFCVFIIPTLFAAYLWSPDSLSWLYLKRGASWQLWVLVPLLMIVDLPLINLLSHLNQQITLPDVLAPMEQLLRQMEDQAADLTEAFLKVDSVWGLLGNLLLMALLPAIGEEMCFRGSCLGLMDPDRKICAKLSRRTHVAIWVTAILFSLVHFQFYGFVPRMLLGALLGYLLCWTGSLWVPVLAHFTNNAIAVLGYYFADKGTINAESIDNFGFGDTLWAGMLSLVLTVLMLWVVYKVSQRPRQASL